MSLDFLEVYRLYARRWTTEVAYKDCKTLLNLGKYQSRYFAAQIAGFTLTMMQYNIPLFGEEASPLDAECQLYSLV